MFSGTDFRRGYIPELAQPEAIVSRRARIAGAALAAVLLALVGTSVMAWTRSAHVTQPVAATSNGADVPVATRHVAIKVSGMFCASCEATVRTMLTRTAGVRSADVNVGKGLATVEYDPKVTTPAKLADVINRLGYTATLPVADGKASLGS